VQLALLLAAMAIVTALVGWRAEVAGSKATDADRRGAAGVAALAAERAKDEGVATADELVLRRYQSALSAAETDRAAARAAGDATARALLTVQADADQAVAAGLRPLVPTDYVVGPGSDGTIDVQRRVQDMIVEDQVDPGATRWFTVADGDQVHRLWLLGIAVALVMAMCLVTLAEHRVHHRRLALRIAAPGVALFLAGAALFVVGVP
jgi:hypothetical protein